MFDFLKKDKFRVRAITFPGKGELGHTSHNKDFKDYKPAIEYFEQIISDFGKDCKVERTRWGATIIGKKGFKMSIDLDSLA